MLCNRVILQEPLREYGHLGGEQNDASPRAFEVCKVVPYPARVPCQIRHSHVESKFTIMPCRFFLVGCIHWVCDTWHFHFKLVLVSFNVVLALW